MSKIKPRAKIPKEAELDEVIEIKTLIRHPMHLSLIHISEPTRPC